MSVRLTTCSWLKLKRPKVVCATCPIMPEMAPRIIRETMVPSVKNRADFMAVLRLSDDSAPEYPTMSPSAGSVQQALVAALTTPRSNAKTSPSGSEATCCNLSVMYTSIIANRVLFADG